jgi:uncharacterized SAM-binding protein YcdF (DUF218 family)
MFIFKKLVSQFFFPMPLCLFVCFTGLVLLWWTKRQKTGRSLVTTGLLLLTMLSYEPIGDALLRPLERHYPMYRKSGGPPVKYVVVLGGGHSSDPSLPLVSQISDPSLKRLVEGIRIHRDNPGSKLVLSGGRWLDPIPNAKILADTARLLGVPDSEILLEGESKDTEEEARLLKSLLTTNEFILVTSASHMPRAMALFTKHGMKPEPAPVEHVVKESPIEPGTFFPSGGALHHAERAFYEYLGILWTRCQEF